ncbi:MAG: long-chain fatty acid--CoA ligase, partial [Chloroflexi bacterium]|nr:long-chain fatty acid--CoA ligase [Chloroflexota bacterium]
SWRMQASQDNPLNNRVWLKHYSKETPPTVPIPKRPLHSFLESTANWLPKKTAIQFYGSKLTYQQLDKRVNQFAHVLHGQGVRPGSRVMIVLPNMPQVLIAFYATLKIGGVAVMPNPDAGITQIVKQARQTEPKVLVTLQGFTQLAKALASDSSVPQIILADIETAVTKRAYQQIASRWGIIESHSPENGESKKLGKQMFALIQDAPPEAPTVTVKSDDLAAIIFTSGTTDEPKGVCLTHANLVANALQTRHWFPDLHYGKETFLSVLPLIHSYGLTNCMNLPIVIGATMVLLPAFDVKEVLEHIKEHEVTVFPGVPSMYTAINQVPGVREYGLSSIKGCLSGAAPLPVEVQEAFEKLTHGRLVEGYGLTEASPVTHANPLYGVRKPGSIGVPLPNTEAKIVDMITDEDLPPGQIGELLVKGPQIMKGYWLGEGQFDTEMIKDGWLDTGDVAVQDGDGYFQIINRKKDTIIFGEYNVYPRDVEEVIYENNKVLEVAVVGVGVEAGEQKVKAFVVPRPGTNLTEDELMALCRRRLEPYAVPWEIEFRESLPKSFIGKVLRRLL